MSVCLQPFSWPLKFHNWTTTVLFSLRFINTHIAIQIICVYCKNTILLYYYTNANISGKSTALNQGTANFFCIKTEGKYFRLWELFELCGLQT